MRMMRAVATGLLSVMGVLSLAGCDDPKARAVTPKPPPAPVAEAGGACQLLDYDMIKKAVGVDLGVAAAGKQGETYTCAVQPAGESYPDLVLAVTATTADEKVFTGTVQPVNAVAVPGVGRAAFAVQIVSTGDAGPGVEIGWLAGNGRLLVLRYRLALAATPDQVDALPPKMIELARAIDRSSV